MFRYAALAFAACILGGCVSAPTNVESPRMYPSYRATLISEIQRAFISGPNASAPAEVRAAFEECGADFVLSGFTETEKAKLDAWVRREITLTDAEIRDMDARVKARLGGNLSYESLDRLNSVCPEWVPAFKKNLKPS